MSALKISAELRNSIGGGISVESFTYTKRCRKVLYILRPAEKNNRSSIAHRFFFENRSGQKTPKHESEKSQLTADMVQKALGFCEPKRVTMVFSIFLSTQVTTKV